VKLILEKEDQKTLGIISVFLSIFFLINILIKWRMFGLYSNTAQESWLSGVSSIFVQNWLHDGILNLKFGMFRTFDSIEMRNFSDREVYSSFLPGCLILPYLVAKIFSLEANLVYFQFWACLFHFLGSLCVGLISFLLCKSLKLTLLEALSYSLISGFFYIFGYLNFMQLDFGYYTDTSIYLIYLFFLLTEFLSSTKTRLWSKAILIFIGLSFEWFFLSVTVVSLVSELFRKDNRGFYPWVLLSHLGPFFLALGLYIYQLLILEKIDHTYLRFMRRTVFNSVSQSAFKNSLSELWQKLCLKHGVMVICSEIMFFWNLLESKFFKENNSFKNICVIAFASSFIQILAAFEHSAVHFFSGIKLMIPVVIFLPFFAREIAILVSRKHTNKILITLLLLVFIGNTVLLNWVISRWRPEHKIYKQIDKVFQNYAYEDLFFSYNLQVLMDIYEKEDIKIESNFKFTSFDRDEGEPFTHLLTRKQIYFIESPQDVLKMLNNRNLIDKAKVHLVFFDEICDDFMKRNQHRIKQKEDFYIVDLEKTDLINENFVEQFSCAKRMTAKIYFAFNNI
jgi:hypothetical protein